MGTRNLIAVYKDGIHRIAQYGQWDGYPEGQGRTVLEFLNDKSAVWQMREYRLRKDEGIRFLTDDEIEKLNAEKNPIAHRPQLSRNIGAGVLKLAATVDNLVLVDSIKFAADSLFCEWAYVIDFDTNVLEVYKGFNTKPAVGRFKDFPIETGSEYYPVTLIKSYPLDDLPTIEQLVADCDPAEEEEIA